MIDRSRFFTGARALFGGSLSQSQVDGMSDVLDAWDAHEFTDLRWLGYMLGTDFHETGRTMQPIHEYGSDAYFTRMYDINGARPDVARALGNLTPGDGIKYCGRGFIQLTGKTNYARFGALLGIDLAGTPSLAMDPKIAVKIMFAGMTGAPKDTFSGVNLQRYFNDAIEDWVGARHIINGQDHATEIAGTAQAFYRTLAVLSGGPAPVPDPPQPVPQPETPEMQLLKKIYDLLIGHGARPITSVRFGVPRFTDLKGNIMPASLMIPAADKTATVPLIFHNSAGVANPPTDGAVATSDAAVGEASLSSSSEVVVTRVATTGGSCVITYTGGGVSDTLDVTIEAEELPLTSMEFDVAHATFAA